MIEIILPAMGEGIIEAEITRWLVKEGMWVEVDTPVVEVATDKVDSELPSPGSGIIHKILTKEGETAKIGQVIAIISEDGEKDSTDLKGTEKEKQETPLIEPAERESAQKETTETESMEKDTIPKKEVEESGSEETNRLYKAVAFLSPVIRKLAMENEISPTELQNIPGSGTGGRITKEDLLKYLSSRPVPESDRDITSGKVVLSGQEKLSANDLHPGKTKVPQEFLSREQIYGSDPYTVEEMDRTRKLIADHMDYSRHVSPHVSSFVETDVTEMISWRKHNMDAFQKKYGQKLTLTTLILEAVIRALKEHPRINASVDGYKIILKKNINLGMATALPDGNLIVPVIHNADGFNLAGLAEKVNDLAERARENRLLPSEIRGGTFTVTNMGQFNNIAGTPIINQPEVAILAVGAIVKKTAVVETTEGDTIGIRNMLILTLSYDHRVVDGALGGSFLNNIGEHLQSFDSARII